MERFTLIFMSPVRNSQEMNALRAHADLLREKIVRTTLDCENEMDTVRVIAKSNRAPFWCASRRGQSEKGGRFLVSIS